MATSIRQYSEHNGAANDRGSCMFSIIWNKKNPRFENCCNYNKVEQSQAMGRMYFRFGTFEKCT